MSSGRTSTPTLINLPPPPVDPMTPSDMPGTPTSTTTSLSELSTVAIKDGHRGHLHHNPMDAERADRISRLAGLDRVGHNRLSAPNASTASGGYTRSDMNPNAPPGNTANNPTSTTPGGTAHAYFDSNNAPQIHRERSTVGSASATGSAGGRTTWASGSASDGGYDRMSDMDVDATSSVGAFSDDNPSAAAVASGMVPLGDAAAGRAPGRPLGVPSPAQSGSPVQGKSPQPTAAAQQLRQQQLVQDARLIDGVTYDRDVVDTVTRTPPPADE